MTLQAESGPQAKVWHLCPTPSFLHDASPLCGVALISPFAGKLVLPSTILSLLSLFWRRKKSLSLNQDGCWRSGIFVMQTDPPDGPRIVCAVIRPEEAVGECRLVGLRTLTQQRKNKPFSFFR